MNSYGTKNKPNILLGYDFVDTDKSDLQAAASKQIENVAFVHKIASPCAHSKDMKYIFKSMVMSTFMLAFECLNIKSVKLYYYVLML